MSLHLLSRSTHRRATMIAAALSVAMLAGPAHAAPTPTSTPTPTPTSTQRLSPAKVTIPALGVRAHVVSVSVVADTLTAPADVSHVGWLWTNASLSDTTGHLVLVGHASDPSGRPGAFADPRFLRIGSRVTLTDSQGTRHRFVLAGRAQYHRGHVPASVFTIRGPLQLVLITCAHRVELPGGRFHYTDNLVLTADPVR